MESDNKTKYIRVFNDLLKIELKGVDSIMPNYIDGHFTILDKEGRVLGSFQNDKYSFVKIYEYEKTEEDENN